jgi:hypothetical protein
MTGSPINFFFDFMHESRYRVEMATIETLKRPFNPIIHPSVDPLLTRSDKGCFYGSTHGGEHFLSPLYEIEGAGDVGSGPETGHNL